MAHVVAIDIGGTFTDLVAFDEETGKVSYTKSPTTYENFAVGITDCFHKAGIALSDVHLVNHGTTLVINALIQRVGGKSALVTTRGFRDVLEIARGNRPDPLDLHYRRHEPLIPRDLRFEVQERMDASGQPIQPLDTQGLRELAASLRKVGVESVAVFFLNSYANPAHEEEAARILREELPDAFVTCSTELSREWYEYERTSTVCANAFVGPQVNSYLRGLERELRGDGFDGRIYMMGSNGGVLTVDRTCRQPITLVESGPIGGCIGAGAYAHTLGLQNLITFDMGGTTAKCTLVEEGRFSVESIYYADGYRSGFPIKSPVLSIVEVGAGGGSIAWVDGQGRLHVGPQSAGSTPGPACYGRGGVQATVTDANLVLGRLNPDNFLGGELKLDVGAARAAVQQVADALGYVGEDAVVRAALGIVELATVIMAGSVRRTSVEHGRDPRDFALFACGGGGPLHGGALARELAIPMLLVPAEPGNFSAAGMLLADARIDESKTFTGVLRDATVGGALALFAELEQAGAAALRAEFECTAPRFERFAEMRYVGQRHNIKVPVTGLEDAGQIRAAFERNYERRYGHADPAAAVEFQGLHLSSFAPLRRPQVASLARASRSCETGHRRVWFDAAGGVETAIYQRDALAPGFRADGPALIEEYGSSTLVWPGDRFEIGPLREIRVQCGHQKGAQAC